MLPRSPSHCERPHEEWSPPWLLKFHLCARENPQFMALSRPKHTPHVQPTNLLHNTTMHHFPACACSLVLPEQVRSNCIFNALKNHSVKIKPYDCGIVNAPLWPQQEGQNFPSTVSSEEFNQTDLILRKKWAIFAIMQHASSNCL